MPAPPPLLALLGLWTLWGLSWVAVWRWTGQTQDAAGAPAQAHYRIVNIVGWVALFADGLFRPSPQGIRWMPFLPPLWRVPDWLGWVLLLVAAAGFALAWSARLTLGRLWSADVTRKEGHRIVDHGPYAVVRHPIYTAILTGATALAAVKATPIALGGAALMILGYHLKARVEERFLAAQLGAADYAAYAARVPMLIPFGPR